MTQTYKKKLIEVAIPLEAINAASAYEKMPGIGPHPRGLHQYWARRPLVACRAVLFAQLVDDPSSLPEEFPTDNEQEIERKRLFLIMEDLVKWENSNNEEVLERARAEIRRSCGSKLPSVYDPFSGGGSIPLEAQRLGLSSYGSDLNPVSVLIGKAMLEIPRDFKDMEPIHPGIRERNYYRNAEGLAEDVKYYCEWVRKQAESQIGHFYPQAQLPKEHGGGQAEVIAWIWSRTVPSPDPAFPNIQVPIAASFLLNGKKNKETWVEPLVDKHTKTINYTIRKKGTKEEIARAKQGTKAGGRANFKCLMSGAPITSEYIKKMGKSGQMGHTLIAIVAKGSRNRIYLEPTKSQEELAKQVQPIVKPETKLPNDPRNFWTVDYGLVTFGDLFTKRQLLALSTLSELVQKARAQIILDSKLAEFSQDETPLQSRGQGATAYSEAICVYMTFVINRCADYNNSIVGWNPSNEKVMHLFGKQSIPMIWDFGEANIMANVVGGFQTAAEFISKCIERLHPSANGVVSQSDAQAVIYPNDVVISTDPPYYDNIAYADLSDFFYIWMKPILKEVLPELHMSIATPKMDELVATPYRHGGKKEAEMFFLKGMTAAISKMAISANHDFPTTIYYAFKQNEVAKEGVSSTGWATFIQGVLSAGFSVVGTWPIRSEQAYRMIASGTNALANSVVLVCRKRELEADKITRAQFIRILKRELPPALHELKGANISPADMPQSAIGPGIGAFSRFSAVLEADDSNMSVKTALQLINHQLAEFLDNVMGDFDTNTSFTIKWYELNGLNTGDYGTALNIANARGTTVESIKHAGIVESEAGKVRILKRNELLKDWDPERHPKLTVWECLQYLVRQHEQESVSYNTALMLRKFGDKAEAVKDLAYCLYDICANKRQDAQEATAYNALIADWSDLTREAATIHDTRGSGQTRMEL